MKVILTGLGFADLGKTLRFMYNMVGIMIDIPIPFIAALMKQKSRTVTPWVSKYYRLITPMGQVMNMIGTNIWPGDHLREDLKPFFCWCRIELSAVSQLLWHGKLNFFVGDKF